MRPATGPKHNCGDHAQDQGKRGQNTRCRGESAFVDDESWKRVLGDDRRPREHGSRRYDREHRASDHGSRRGVDPGRRGRLRLQPHIAERRRRHAHVPREVEPRCGLWSGAEQAGGRERARKGQRVRDDDQGREQVTASQQQQRPGAFRRVPREQQHGGDEMGGRDDALHGRNEAVAARQRNQPN